MIPGLGRSPGEGECLPTPVFWPEEFHGLYGPWGRKESDTTERLSLTLAHLRKQLEKEMATHSSVLAWRIPGTGEPNGLPSAGVQLQQPGNQPKEVSGV